MQTELSPRIELDRGLWTRVTAAGSASASSTIPSANAPGVHVSISPDALAALEQSKADVTSYVQFFPVRAGFSAVTLADGAANPGAISSSAGRSFEQVATAARASLDAKYTAMEASGAPFDIDSAEDANSLMGDLDRRSLYAVSSNAGGQFTQQEQEIAAALMRLEQRLATGLYPSSTSPETEVRDPFLGNEVTRNKAAMAFLDGVSAEEQQSIEWAQQKALAARLAYGDVLPPASASDTTPAAAPGSDQWALTEGADFDEEAFAAAWNAFFARGRDLEDIAESLMGSMEQVLRERPDLADAGFGLVSDHGKLRIVSDKLRIDDKAWLESKLNSNEALVEAVKHFHDHTVDRYALYSKAVGKPLSDAEYKEASEGVDRQFDYVSQLQEIGDQVRANYRSSQDLTFVDASGAELTLDADPSSAAGFVSFMTRIYSLESGIGVLGHDGRTDRIPFNNPFHLATVGIKVDDPEGARPSLGLHAQA